MLKLDIPIRIQIGLAWLAAVSILLIQLGTGPLTDIDEGAFSEASREMLIRGDWISPWLLDAPRFDKPVLIHWLQMISFIVFGLDTFAARLPSALAAMLWIGAIGSLAFRVSKRIWPERDGLQSYFWAVIISATTIGLPAIGRAATADALLNALLVLSLVCIWNFFFESESRLWSRMAALFVGLGLLTKGPIAVLIPGVASLCAAIGWGLSHAARHSSPLRTHGGNALRLGLDRWRKLVSDPAAWLIVVAICAPWYALQYHAQGNDFIRGFFGTHNIGRFVATMHGFSAGPWYYPAWILIATLPWLPLLMRSVIVAGKTRLLLRGEVVMLWGVFLFVMVFFSFSATKLPHYGFYGLSGLIVMMSLIVADRLWASKTQRVDAKFFPERAFLASILVSLAALPLWWSLLAAHIRDPYYQTVWETAGNIFSQNLGWFSIPLICGLAVLLIRPAIGLPIGGVVFALSLHGLIVPAVMTALRAPLLEAAQVIKSMPAETFMTWRLAAPSLSFHAQRVIQPGDPVAGSLVVMHAKDFQHLQLALQKAEGKALSTEKIWAAGGFEMIRIK